MRKASEAVAVSRMSYALPEDKTVTENKPSEPCHGGMLAIALYCIIYHSGLPRSDCILTGKVR